MKTQEKNKYKFLATTKRLKKYKAKWNGIPAFMKKTVATASLSENLFFSIVVHIILFLLLWGLFSILKDQIINPRLKQDQKIKDIEFVIKSSQKNRIKFKPQKPISGPTERQAATNEGNGSSETPKLSKENKSNSRRKSVKDGFASIPTASPDDFSIPMPKFKSASPNSGRLAGRSGHAYSSSSEDGESSAGSQGGSTNGIGSAKGNGFDKNATRKAIAAYDISPYVNELRRSVRMNWKPAKNEDGHYVELFLRIAKDGRLIILNVKKTSEVKEVDEAALSAVRKTLPLAPLPQKYPKSFLDLIFTFNSNSSALGSRF